MILRGHVLDVLRTLEADRFQCVVTSPPYYALRVYHTEGQVWGGEEGCEHEWEEKELGPKTMVYLSKSGGKILPDMTGNEEMRHSIRPEHGNRCLLCGAWRGELGAEPTPALYIEHMLEVFAEVKRVLRPDGVLWLNMGDSYSGRANTNSRGYLRPVTDATSEGRKDMRSGHSDGVPAKSLCLIPERLLIGLADQGWIVRNKVVWHKPNAMPTSAKDRFKCCWEPVYLLTKGQRYNFRLEAVKVPSYYGMRGSSGADRDGKKYTHERVIDGTIKQRTNWAETRILDDANPGDVWRIPSQPRSENHFAAFPDELPKRCILASTDPGDEVLDPFVGRGTTVIVAKQLGRIGTGIELSEEYADMAEENVKREASQEVLTLA